MSSAPLTADQVHQQVHDLRAQAASAPEKIELGRSQIAAIEASQREAAGTADIGPLREFQGMQVVKSRREDHVRLLAANEAGDDVEVEVAETTEASGPDAPAKVEPSGS